MTAEPQSTSSRGRMEKLIFRFSGNGEVPQVE